MGLLRLMGNKADVVKGLAKRCNENWRVAPTSDIVSFLVSLCLLTYQYTHMCAGFISLRHPRSFNYDDTEFEPLREDPLALALQLPGPNFYRNDGRKQPDQ